MKGHYIKIALFANKKKYFLNLSNEDIPGPNHGEAQVSVCYELVGGRAWAGVTFLHWLVGTRTGVRSPDSRPLAAGRPATR